MKLVPTLIKTVTDQILSYFYRMYFWLNEPMFLVNLFQLRTNKNPKIEHRYSLKRRYIKSAINKHGTMIYLYLGLSRTRILGSRVPSLPWLPRLNSDSVMYTIYFIQGEFKGLVISSCECTWNENQLSGGNSCNFFYRCNVPNIGHTRVLIWLVDWWKTII